MLAEPLSPPSARALIRQIVENHSIRFTGHARQEMVADALVEDDVVAVLRGGIVEPAELERGTWRYRIRAGRIYVVVAFRSEVHLVVVTAGRTK
jgi:hypothetical protein